MATLSHRYQVSHALKWENTIITSNDKHNIATSKELFRHEHRLSKRNHKMFDEGGDNHLRGKFHQITAYAKS